MALAMHPQHNNAWEDSIVPTLRKRLENESRILSKRLSVHSIPTTEGGPSQPSISSGKPNSRSPTPSSRPPSTSPNPRGNSDGIRPSYIPRLASSDGRPQYPPYNGLEKTSSGFTSNNNSLNASPGQRARTHSTPYPSESDSAATALPAPPSTSNGRRTPNGGTLNGMPTPASSRAASPLINGRPSDRPSRIPTATGKRARSNSNAASTDSHYSRPQTGRKASAPLPHKSRKTSEGGNGHVMFPPSPDTSPDLWLESDKIEREDALRAELSHFPSEHKIRDEAPPFNPNRVSRVPSFEEREFEHWYRGEVSRNGGRGEIKVGKGGSAKEMLEIAIGGHKLDAGDNWQTRLWSGSVAGSSKDMAMRDMEDYAQHQASAEADYEEVNYHYDDHMGSMEDEDQHASSPTPGAEEAVTPEPGPSSRHRRTPSASKVPQPTSQSKATVAKAKTSTTAQQPGKTTSGTSKPPGKTPSTPKKTASRQRQRAISKGSKGGSGESGPRPSALEEAIPPWAQRQQITGNWDDVVLPTVAKKMGLTPEVTLLGDGTSSKGKRSEEDERAVAPAPGTFGYDATKYRAPGSHIRRSSDDYAYNDNSKEQDELPQSPIRSVEYDYTPPRSNSPPPFSSYLNEEEGRKSMQKPAQSGIPVRAKRQSGIPQSAPTPPVSQPHRTAPAPPEVVTGNIAERRAAMEKMQPVKEDGGDDAGCCKCTIM